MTKTRDTRQWRFKWSHQAHLHRWAVQRLNRMVAVIPFRWKYGAGILSRRKEPPYSLIQGKTVVQIGAPHDTLMAGRSRGMYFSLLAGNQGKVLIIEPDPVSVASFKQALEREKIHNTIVHWSAAWSGPTEIELYVNRAHPATNFSSGTVTYDDNRLREYETISVTADSVDNILAHYQIQNVHLISLTTNWAELEILDGMRQTIASGLPYICLAYGNPGTDYIKMMEGFGYRFLSHDDRGMTFQNLALSSAQLG